MKFMLAVAALSLPCLLHSASVAESNPYQSGKAFSVQSRIDEIMLDHWGRRNVKPAGMCSDAVFVRRIYIDLTGALPTLEQTRTFLASRDLAKRRNLIDQLLKREEFPLYYSLKWCDILRVKSEFPIKMWPNAVQAYHHWIWASLRSNKPYDQFAGELLTTSGSNFREPAVNFYRGTQDRTPQGLARIAALTFLCSRIETWPADARKEFEKLFTRVAYKPTDEWKEEVVYLDPAPIDSYKVRLPGGTVLKIDQNADPRKEFADWLTSPENLWFAQAAVNRTWFWLFGRGIVDDPDDFQLVRRPRGMASGFFRHKSKYSNLGNPPVSRKLLDYLAREFIRSGYDFRELCRLIVSSSVYQQSCIPGMEMHTAESELAVYPLKRIDAEVLIDTFTSWGGLQTRYVSVIPEPFTYIPPAQRTIGLADGSISSAFLETFGRPARDTGLLKERNNQMTYSQRLYLLNSPQIIWKVSRSPFLKTLARRSKGDPEKLINSIYLTVLSRPPTNEELATLGREYPVLNSANPAARGKKTNSALLSGGGELIWALVNSKEFLFQH